MSSFEDWNANIIEEFRTTGGSAGNFGRSLVLLHHLGAKSGTERVSPVRAIRDDADTWLIAASKGGSDEHPGWYHNLLAKPDVEIETPDDGVVAVHAVRLDGDARDAAWERFKQVSDGFRQYEERTSRIIPVIELRRR